MDQIILFRQKIVVYIIKTKRVRCIDSVGKNNFEFLHIIGRGGFSDVWKALAKKSHKFYAIKKIYKANVIDKKFVDPIKFERELLVRMDHP